MGKILTATWQVYVDVNSSLQIFSMTNEVILAQNMKPLVQVWTAGDVDKSANLVAMGCFYTCPQL